MIIRPICRVLRDRDLFVGRLAIFKCATVSSNLTLVQISEPKTRLLQCKNAKNCDVQTPAGVQTALCLVPIAQEKNSMVIEKFLLIFPGPDWLSHVKYLRIFLLLLHIFFISYKNSIFESQHT